MDIASKSTFSTRVTDDPVLSFTLAPGTKVDMWPLGNRTQPGLLSSHQWLFFFLLSALEFQIKCPSPTAKEGQMKNGALFSNYKKFSFSHQVKFPNGWYMSPISNRS